MPINAPFMFADEEKLVTVMGTLDSAQQRAIPVLFEKYMAPGLN